MEEYNRTSVCTVCFVGRHWLATGGNSRLCRAAKRRRRLLAFLGPLDGFSVSTSSRTRRVLRFFLGCRHGGMGRGDRKPGPSACRRHGPSLLCEVSHIRPVPEMIGSHLERAPASVADGVAK
jgi:hypothetical protein